MNTSTLKFLFFSIICLSTVALRGMESDTVIFKTPQIEARTGEQICIPVLVENFKNIVSLQFGIEFNPELLNYEASYGDALPDIRFGETSVEQGELRMLWFDSGLSPATLEDGSTIVEICFEVIGFNNESTTVEVKSLEMLQVEITDINDQLVPYQVESGSIDIVNFLDCFMLPFCLEEVNLDYVEGIEITPNMLIDDFDYMLGCFNLTEEDIKILDLSDPNATPQSSIVLSCSNLRRDIHIAVLYQFTNTNSGPSYSTICNTSLKLNIGAADQACINTDASCFDPNLCQDITVNIDSTITYFAYSDLLGIEDINSCALQFYTNYTSIALDAMETTNGFNLTCKDYRDEVPVSFKVIRELSAGGIIDIQLCTSVISMDNVGPTCEDYNIPTGSFPISIINETSGVHPEVRLRLNDEPLNAVISSIYEAKIEELLDIPNLLKISPNEPTLAGHSTLDLVMAYKALVSQELAPTQAIAADVDLSGSLTTKDLFEMRKTILGIKQTEHIGKAFLVETSTDFSKFDLFEFSNSYTQYQFEASEIDPSEGLTFEVFHYGDVNNAISDIHKNNEAVLNPQVIELQDQKLLANQTYRIPISISRDEQIVAAGAQLKLNDALILDINHNYTGEDFDFHMANPQSVNFLYFDNKNQKEIQFELIISPLSDIQLKDVLTIGTDLNAEIVTSELHTAQMEISWTQAIEEPKEFCVYPNPASALINIDIPSSYIGGRLELYSILGKQLYNQTIISNKESITLSENMSKGSVIVRIYNGEQIESMKLFIL